VDLGGDAVPLGNISLILFALCNRAKRISSARRSLHLYCTFDLSIVIQPAFSSSQCSPSTATFLKSLLFACSRPPAGCRLPTESYGIRAPPLDTCPPVSLAPLPLFGAYGMERLRMEFKYEGNYSGRRNLQRIAE